MNKLAYNVEEAAELLSISRRTLYELIRSKRIGSIKIGRRRLIRLVDIEEFLATAEGAA